jgi:hypothetical protein
MTITMSVTVQATIPTGRWTSDRTRPKLNSFCYIRIDLTGRLTVLHAPDGGADLFPLGRRTASGVVERLDLDDSLAVWLVGDAQHAGVDTGRRTRSPAGTRDPIRRSPS